jgi:hypothetical protein
LAKKKKFFFKVVAVGIPPLTSNKVVPKTIVMEYDYVFYLVKKTIFITLCILCNQFRVKKQKVEKTNTCKVCSVFPTMEGLLFFVKKTKTNPCADNLRVNFFFQKK